MTIETLLMITGALISLLLALLAWIGNGMVTKMGGIENALNRIEKELGILSNDHMNLKSDVHDVKARLSKIGA